MAANNGEKPSVPDVNVPDVDDVPFEQLEGHELLLSPAFMKPSQAIRLTAAAAAALEGDDVNMEALPPVFELIEERYVVDEDGYQEFFRKHGLAGVTHLVLAYLGELEGGGQS